ncbi:hypothetical protein [Paraburkholderia sp. J76]|uniref:hypothetical protein n=1 Tax=Paraburkholderia sp. J76 TaxID=2805439 RepID=UPI002ABD7AD3|nr:hypothetical protein [Paraburkholderia sp. J76]
MNANQTTANLFAALHQHARVTFGADHVGEYVTEVPGFPWFAVALGDEEMVAEYHEGADRYVLKTFEHDGLVSRKGNAGALTVWDAMRSKAGANAKVRRLTLDEERRLLDRLAYRPA